MAKKYIIYASGKDLATVPVTQNESGKYYKNSAGTYFKPILAEFDTATLPTGYKTYIGGSHAKNVSNPNRNPIDFSIVAGAVLSMNVDVNVLATNPSDGSWCKITPVGSNYVIALVHTYQWAKGLVKAGSPICKIAPQSVTGFPPHLHLDEWSNRGLRIRKLVLDGDIISQGNTTMFNIGDKIKFNENTKLREAFIIDDKYFKRGLTVQSGAVGLVRSIEIANGGYFWYLMSFGDDCGMCAVKKDGGEYWVAKSSASVTNVDGSKVVIPVDNSAKIIELEADIVKLNDKIKVMDGVIIEKNETIEQNKIDYNELEDKYGTEVIKRKTAENDRTKAVSELNAYKMGRFIWVVDMLEKLFPKKK